MTKWLADVTASDRTAEVAVRSLRGRLDAVRDYLRRAATGSDEPENFHQLRVWARRSESALDLYADLLPRRRARRLRRTIRQVRRAAGRVRDCDVFGKRTAGPPDQWPAWLRNKRARAVRRFMACRRRVRWGQGLRRRIVRLLDRTTEQNADRMEQFADRARVRLRPLVEAFFHSAPDEQCGDDVLHRFRLAGKDLRYAMELLAPAFAPGFRDELYPVLGVLQEKLGAINDISAAARRLSRRAERAGDPGELSDLRRWLAAAGEELVRARNEFRQYWSPAAHDALQARFADLLAVPPVGT